MTALEGDAALEAVRWRDVKTGIETRKTLKHLFVFIGATPNTDFLTADRSHGREGLHLHRRRVTRNDHAGLWRLERAPFPLETSCPGVFAAGDVRATSTKRVASAVGEGSVSVQYVHQFLAAHGGSA